MAGKDAESAPSSPVGATKEASSRPTISVVVGSSGSSSNLPNLLAALEPQLDGVEVLVCEAVPSPPEMRAAYPWARFIERRGLLVPELWRDGIDESSGEIVALTIAPMIPAPDWVQQIRAEHRAHDAVGGAIDAGRRLRLADWAEFFCRYSRDMPPFPPHESDDVAGDNAAYKRELLEHGREVYRDGFWEPVFHRRLHADGVALWHTPSVLVHQGRSAGAAAFVAQRLAHGRKYGHQRGAHFSRPRNLAGVLGAPLVPFVMTWRVLRRVFAKRRHRGRALLALPLIVVFNLVWAGAEALGHADMLRSR